VSDDETRDRSDGIGPARSFDERLLQAEQRARRPADTARAGQGGLTSADYSAIGLVLRLGTELVSALIVGVAIGYGLDRWLGYHGLFLIGFSLLGGVAGMLNVWRLAVRTGKTDG